MEHFMEIHLTINDASQTDKLVTKPESQTTLTIKQAKIIFMLLLIIKNVFGYSQADIVRVIQQVHDDVLASDKKIDTKLQKDTVDAICASANRIAQKNGMRPEWFAKEKIYHLLMAK